MSDNPTTTTNKKRTESQYSYEEPPEDEEEKDEEEDDTNKISKSRKSSSAAVVDRWTEAMNNMSLENIKKLASTDTYTIANETYTRKMLTPKIRIQLDRLQTEMEKEKDDEKKMKITEQQAILCLNGMTPEKFENTDIGHLEQVIGACIMAAKGFRKI